MEFFFLAFLVNGGDQHAAALDAHHGSGGQIHDGDAGLADEGLGLIEGVDAAENRAGGAGAVVQGELQQLLGLLHGLAVQNLHSPEIGLGEGLEIHLIGEQRLNDHVGEVDDLLCGRCGGGRLGSGFTLRGLGGFLAAGFQRLHGGDEISIVTITSHNLIKPLNSVTFPFPVKL